MKIALIGATGRTGREVLQRAIARGHHVTAVVRSIEQLAPNDGMTIACGDVFDPDFLAKTVSEHDAIISSLARGGQRRTVLTDATAALLAALQKMPETPHCIVVSQGLLFATINPVVHLLRRLLRAAVTDSVGMEMQLRASDIDWTIVRPPRLTGSQRPRGYHALAHARPRGPAAMSRADLAEFLLDEAESRRFNRNIVGVTSR